MSSKSTDDLEDPLVAKILAGLGGTSPDKLKQLVRGHRELAEIKRNLGPQSKQELWQYFNDRYEIELGTVAVCPGHVSQLDLVWEVYSFVPNILWILSRGYGKTSLMALTDCTQCDHYPGFSSFTIGPGKNQGERKYDHLLPHVVEGGVIGGKELPHIERSTTTKTEWKNGSKMEISLGGDPANANGPRDPRLHRDESELMQEATRKQASNIPAGKKTRDGRYVPAQTVDTSTMKWAGGWVHQQLEEYLDALKEADVDPTQMDPIDAYYLAIERGHRPHTAVRVSCLFEVSAENPTCRSVPDEERRARLIELGRDPDEICQCHTYRKDYWPSDDPDQEPAPRTLEDVCQGRFFRARGHKDFTDVTVLFLANDRETWEAEQECSEPSREGAYLRAYSQDRHGVRDYEPDPENGMIYSTTDWGGTDQHWHGWLQELDRDVYTRAYKGDKVKRMPAGSVVAFGEVMRAEIGNIELGRLVLARERDWIVRYPGWRIHERYHDTAGKAGMLDWRDQLGMTMTARVRKDFVEEVKLVRTMVGGRHFYVDIPACPNLDKALRGWRQVNGREVRNQHTHCFPAGTVIETESGQKSIEAIESGEQIWTRKGLREVLWSGQTKVDRLVVVEHEEGSISCTRDHRFWTQRGWVRACDLWPGYDMLLGCSFRSMAVASSLPTEAMCSLDGRTLTTTAARHTSEDMLTGSRPIYIEKCGGISGERFRKVLMYTIKISTQAITWLKISLLCLIMLIESFMLDDLRPKEDSTILRRYGLSRPRLWLDQKFEKRAESVAQRSGKKDSRTNRRSTYVIIALKSLNRMLRMARQSFAQTTARAQLVGPVGSIMNQESVDGVVVSGWSTVTPELSSVAIRVVCVRETQQVEPVYDLQVEDQHEFIADGLLVHNSMAGVRYFAAERHAVLRALARAGSSQSRPAAAEDEDRRPGEREEELERGIRIVRHGRPAGINRELASVAGAEDSPMSPHLKYMLLRESTRTTKID